MLTPRLTMARQVLWQCLDDPQNKTLRNKFSWTWRFDDTDAARDPTGPMQGGNPPKPSINNMPGLAIWPTTVATPWVLNQAQKLEYTFRCSMWTPHWNLPPAEELWESLVEAWWQTINPATGVEYWRGDPNHDRPIYNLTCGGPTWTPYKVEPDNPNSQWAVQCDWQMSCVQLWNPRVAKADS